MLLLSWSKSFLITESWHACSWPGRVHVLGLLTEFFCCHCPLFLMKRFKDPSMLDRSHHFWTFQNQWHDYKGIFSPQMSICLFIMVSGVTRGDRESRKHNLSDNFFSLIFGSVTVFPSDGVKFSTKLFTNCCIMLTGVMWINGTLLLLYSIDFTTVHLWHKNPKRTSSQAANSSCCVKCGLRHLCAEEKRFEPRPWNP